jgi:hypothetical protein
MKQTDEAQQAQLMKNAPPAQTPKKSTGTLEAMAPRWAAAIGALAFGVIYAVLPDRVTIVPNWLPLVLEIVLLIPLILAGVIRRPLRHEVARSLAFALLTVVTTTLMGGIILFVGTLASPKSQYSPESLLRTAALLWSANVLVFSLWYWEIDGGGPRKRHQHGHQAADFMFPQQVDGNEGHWVPRFFDYLFVAFTDATAFSPTDTYPLTQIAKILMMVEAVNAIAILVIIVGRVVNIL